MRLGILFAAMVAALIACLPSASAGNSYPTEPPAFVIRSVFADGRLWILTDAGSVASIAEGDSDWTDETLPDLVRDICATATGVVAVTGPKSEGGGWSLRRRQAANWVEVAAGTLEKEWPHGLHCESDGITLITNVRLIFIQGNQQTSIHLTQKVGSLVGGAFYGNADHFFVGINHGEWGGGLRRIDRRLGTVVTLESNLTGSLCGGPLNTKCDPVNGLAAAPWAHDCVVAAVGLAHLSEHGRLVEICRDRIKRVYYRRQGFPENDRQVTDDRDIGPTTAFSALIRSGDSLWAAGSDGIYRMRERGVVDYMPLPAFQNIDGIEVSFDLPGIVVLMTEINACDMCSASEPLVVAR